MNTWNYFHKYLQENNITYNQYLQTRHWKDTRKRFYKSKLCKHKCSSCGSTYKLNLHHKTYKRIGKERLSDLCLLCEECHKKVHNLSRNRKKLNLWKATKDLIHIMRNR